MTATILGAERLLRKLRTMPAAVKAEVKAAMAEIADEIVAMMKRLVPVDEGDLRDSIGWRWGSRAPKGAMAVASVGKGDMTITIFAADFKARWQEFGTVKMPASPYFFVSWRASRKNARRRVQAATRRAVKRVAAGG